MSSKLKLFAYLFGLPLLVIMIALWQLSRVGAGPATNERARAAIQQKIDEIRPLTKDRYATVRLPGYSTALAPSLAITYLQREIAALDRTAEQRGWRKPLPWLTLLLAFAAAGIAGFAVVTTLSASKRARQSRDALLSVFDSARRRLPFITTGVTLSLGLAGITLCGFEALGFWSSSPSKNDLRALLFLSGAALVCVFLIYRTLRALPSAFALFEPPQMSLLGQHVRPEDAPGLWKWVREMAQRVHAPVPDNIVLGVDEGFFVTSSSIELYPHRTALTGYTLHLPLPLLALLDKDETAAIIGHELGHFSGDDTLYSQRFMPIYAGVQRSLEAVAQSASDGDAASDYLLRPAWMLGHWFMEQFDYSVAHWSRVRELAADQVGVSVSGVDPSARALIRSTVCAKPLVDELAALRRNPAAAKGDLLIAIRARAARDGLADPSQSLEVSIAHPTDSHPTTVERLKALGVSSDGRPGSELLAQATRPVNLAEPIWFAPLFKDIAHTSAVLSKDYIGAVAAQEAEFDEQLVQVSSLVKATTLRERSIANIAVFSFLLICCVFALGMMVNFAQAPVKLWGVPLTIGLAALFAWATWFFWKRGREPFLSLDGQGLLVIGASEVVPWNRVADLSFTSQSQLFCIKLQLEKSYQPTLHGSSKRRVTFNKKTHELIVNFNGITGMSHQQVADLVVDCWRAGQAKQLLQERQQQRA
jgi:Zn-dependent protease with chaperone function